MLSVNFGMVSDCWGFWIAGRCFGLMFARKDCNLFRHVSPWSCQNMPPLLCEYASYDEDGYFRKDEATYM